MIDYIGVGNRVKAVRISALMSQIELSHKLTVTVGYVCKLENGTVRIRLDLINKISRLYRCDVNWLLWGDIASVTHLHT